MSIFFFETGSEKSVIRSVDCRCLLGSEVVTFDKKIKNVEHDLEILPVFGFFWILPFCQFSSVVDVEIFFETGSEKSVIRSVDCRCLLGSEVVTFDKKNNQSVVHSRAFFPVHGPGKGQKPSRSPE